MGSVVVGVIGLVSGIGYSAAVGSTIGGVAAVGINAGVAIGTSAYQRKKQKERQNQARSAAKKKQRQAMRRLHLQQRRTKEARFETPFLTTNDLTVTVRNPIASRKIVYGRSRVGGVWVFYEKTGDSNEFRHLIIALCEGPIEEIETILFDDTEVPLDGSGNATGTYADFARVKKHLGDQVAADSDAVTECANWTSTHKLLGIAYLYVRLKNNTTLFPNVIPQISAVIKGRNDIILADGTTGYSTNTARCLAHYLQQPLYGPNVDVDGIDPDELANSAAICHEDILRATNASFTTDFGADANQIDSTGHGLSDGDIIYLTTTTTLPAGLAVDLAHHLVNTTTDAFELALTSGGAPIALTSDGSGTHTWRLSEKRYSTNGVIDLGQDVEDHRNALASSMAGTAVRSNGYWRLMAGVHVTPTFRITEDMIVGEIKLRNEIPRRDRVNFIKGIYVAPENNWQPFGFPAVTNAQYVADDSGETIMQDIQLPLTKSPAAAQRIAKIALEENRRSVTLELRCSLTAFPAQAGKTVLVTVSRYGFVDKEFEVLDAILSMDDGTPTVDLSLRETDSAVYDWSHTEEQPVNLPASLVKPGTKVADITSTPTAGSGHSFPLSVTLSTLTVGATIRYSLVSVPSTISSGTEYTAAVSLSDGQTLYAKGFLTGYQDSDGFSGTFTS